MIDDYLNQIPMVGIFNVLSIRLAYLVHWFHIVFIWQWPRNQEASANILREIIFDDFGTSKIAELTSSRALEYI